MDGSIFFLFALAAIAALVFAFMRAAQRRKAAQTTALAMGLAYSTGDPLGLLSLPHGMFRKGDRRRIETTLHGTLEGREIALCDYVYTDVTRDARGNTHQTDHRMSLGVLSLAEPLPPIEIAPEGLGRRLLNAMGVGNDIQFESDEFNREFKVLSEDRDFAFTLIDTAMMDWLMGEATSTFIEIAGLHAVLAVRQIGWEQMPGFAERILAFEKRFPRLVWERYGRRT